VKVSRLKHDCHVAMGEDLEVITSDRAFKRYSINVVW
jgi:hypothetical protein